MDFGDNFRTVMEHPLVLDMAIHTFDAARLITSARPRSVYCHEWNPSGSWYEHEAAAAAIFEMSDGIVYTYHGNWCARGLNTPWECEWRIIGDKGSVLWDGADGFRAEALGDDGRCHPVAVPEVDASAKTGGHDGVIREFVACVRSGQTPETAAADNIYSLAMAHGASASAVRGAKVKFASHGLPAP
jgi:predicted dehydrogenase